MHIKRRWSWIALFCGVGLAACEAEPPETTDTAPGVATPPDAPANSVVGDAVADPRQVQVNCGGELTRPPVDLAWSELAAVGDARLARDASIYLRAHNTGAQPVTVRLVAEVSQRGATRTLDLEPVVLAAGEARRIALSQTTLGIQRARTTFAGHLSVRGAVVDAGGKTIMTVFAPGRSFHMDAEGDALAFYDDETRDRKYGKGDPFGVVPRALRDDPMVLSITDHDEAAQNAAGAIQ